MKEGQNKGMKLAVYKPIYWEMTDTNSAVESSQCSSC